MRRARVGLACAMLWATSPARATCFDGVQNGPESAVDCGGDCPPCERGSACRVPRDCSSGRCAEYVCTEREYVKGTEVPPGYRVETSTADSAAITRTIGWVSLGLGYGGAYAAAMSRPGDVSWLYVPVLGPWIEVADRKQELRGLLALDGLLQTVGGGLVVYGVLASGEQLVRDEGATAHVHVSPTMMGKNGYGVWLDGVF